MKIALINGSPKVKESASGILLDVVKHYLQDDCEIIDLHFKTPNVNQETLDKLVDVDAMVVAFPLYVDGIPAHLLSCLMQIKREALHKENVYIYGIANCGFYEGIQNSVAIDILRNWCNKSGFIWGGGIGAGGGGAIYMLSKSPVEKGPKAPIDKAIKTMVEGMAAKKTNDDIYVQIGLPSFVYKLAAQKRWRKLLKANGLKAKDIGAKPD